MPQVDVSLCYTPSYMAQERRGIDFVRNKIKGTIAEIIF